MRSAVFLLPCLLSLVGLASAEDPAPSDRSSLEVVVTGFENDKGNLALALHNSPDSYLAEDTAKKPFRHFTLPIQDKKSNLVIEDLPPGEYAVTAFHDENDNNKLDTNFLGIPREAIGFSGSERPRFGAPDYDQVRFTLKAGRQQLQIQIKKVF